MSVLMRRILSRSKTNGKKSFSKKGSTLKKISARTGGADEMVRVAPKMAKNVPDLDVSRLQHRSRILDIDRSYNAVVNRYAPKMEYLGV